MIQAYAKQKINAIYCIGKKGKQKIQENIKQILKKAWKKKKNLIGNLRLGLKIAVPHGKVKQVPDSAEVFILQIQQRKVFYTELDNQNVIMIKIINVKSLGQFESDQNQYITIKKGCKILVGELLKFRLKAKDEYNEYVVYSEDQVMLRYIVQISVQDNLQVEEK